MAKGKIFEYVVLFHEKDTKDANQNIVEGKSEIITDLSHMLAKNEQEVGTRIARALDDKYIDKLDQIEIIIRPFN